jgi:acetyl-CoA carboxylase biotin carboxylase subunit
VAIARQAGYNNAGTVEFLLDQSGAFYFIEANARLQVEHTVTEMVSGIDLVREQLRIAAGEPISVDQEGVQLRGWAIECRVLAEDAEQGFLPSLGRVAAVTEPSGPGVRVDSSLFAGLEVGQHYDSLLAKLVVWGQDRPEALRRLARALGEYKILGVKTTIPFHQLLLTNAEFQAGELDTHLVQRLLPPAADGIGGGNQALIVAALLQHERQTNGAKAAKSAWRQAARQDATHRAARGGPWRSTF